MFGNMMEKLQAMQQKSEDAKQRLDGIIVTGEAPGRVVVVEMTGNRKIKNVSLSDDFYKADKEEQEDLLVIAISKALENAENVFESEMKSVAMGMIPGL